MIKHVKFNYKFGFNVSERDDFSKIKLVQSKTDGAKYKVLYVLDYIPSADLREKKHLLSGTSQETFDNLLKFAKLPKHDYLLCSFHACRTIKQPDTFVENAYEAFEQRLFDIIESYVPDKIVVFGRRPFQALCPKEFEMTKGNHHYFIGVPFTKSLKIEGKKKQIVITRAVAIDKLFAGEEASLALVGYIAENLRNAHHGDLIYKINRPELKIECIDTIKKFDKFFDKLQNLTENDAVAVDTETDNLYKINNRVLTIQFSFDKETSHIIPLCHKDTPYTNKELRYIFKRLKYYFEHVHVKTHIYANAQFDLAVMKTQFDIHYYCSPVTDIFGAEMAYDENKKFLKAIEGAYYYSLGNLSCQYGDFSYLSAKFSKSDRATISTTDLNEEVLRYCALDTVIPFAIYELQLKKAKDIQYKKYSSMIHEQMSDVVHSLATLEYNGYAMDIEYLFSLKLPDSPINKEIDRLLSEFYSSAAVQELNKELLAKKGIPEKTLFGAPSFAFSVRVNAHKAALFFDKLKLKPINIGKNGVGNVDKKFQAAYEHVEEVKLFSAYAKATKLRNSYVNQMLNFWAENEDFKTDRRIRCKFDYLPVVTGRVSAREPGLQQIPSRSELGKHIKRLFIAPRGKFIVKVDYSAHEVRGWGIISKDSEVAKAFRVGLDLMEKYKTNPSADLLKRIELEGDVHKVNSSFFFAKKIEDVTKDDRNAIKGIIFGLIYGMLISTLSKTLKRELDDTKALVKKFMERFKKGGAWFKEAEQFGEKHYYVESPLGRRRNLFGYIYSKADEQMYSRIKSRMDRQAKNSQVQGMGSDFMMIGIRSFCRRIWEYSQKSGYYPHIKPCVSVHDSLEVETDYEHLMLTLTAIEKALTSDVKEIVKKRHCFELNSDLQIDYELGISTDKMYKWVGDLDILEEIVYKSLIRQNDLMLTRQRSKKAKSVEEKPYSDSEIKSIMESVFNKEYMSDWMIKQLENKPRFKKYKFDERRFNED